MTTIYRKSASRLTVAEAKRLVCEAVPKEPAVDFFVAPDGSIKVELNHEANTAAPFINPRFIDACSELGINPRMTHIPTITGYTGEGIYQDLMYSITHDEFVRYADLHDVAVTVGDAPSVGQAQPEPDPAPATAAQVEPVQRSAAQDAAILNAIREAGHDPLALPKNDSGKRGIKAVIRDKLKGTHALFPKVGTQFDKAWERLRARKEIADSE